MLLPASDSSCALMNIEDAFTSDLPVALTTDEYASDTKQPNALHWMAFDSARLLPVHSTSCVADIEPVVVIVMFDTANLP